MQLIGVVTNLQLTKKVPVIFLNLRGYDSHLIFNELKNFDVKVDVIPNTFEKYMAFFLNKNLVFIDSIQSVNAISLTSSIRYILKIDLKYPDELHALRNDYLLAPEKLPIPYDILSDYCRKIADKYKIKVGGVKKLIPNLSNKTNYVLRHKNLQLYLSLE